MRHVIILFADPVFGAKHVIEQRVDRMHLHKPRSVSPVFSLGFKRFKRFGASDVPF